MKSFLFFLLVASCLPSIASAQRQVEIRAFLNDPVNPGAVFQVQTSPRVFNALPLVVEGLSKPIKVELVQDRLTLHGPSGSDPSVPPPMLTSTIVPPGTMRCIVVIAPTGKSTTPYHAIAIDDSRQAFPYGESRIINFTTSLLAIQAGSLRLPVPVGQVTSLPEITAVDAYKMAQTNFYAKSGNEWVAITERQLKYMKNLRRLFIAHITPHAQAPSIRTISDLEPIVLPPQ